MRFAALPDQTARPLDGPGTSTPRPSSARSLHARRRSGDHRPARGRSQIGQAKLTGFVGWVIWGVAHVYFLIGLRNRIAVAFDWAWSWLTRQRNIRLIVQHRGR